MQGESKKEAIFPLSIFLLPGEETYLHIFEPRYRQLLEDVEQEGIDFGIYYKNDENKSSIGSMMELVRVVKRYETGESDILVRCKGLFYLDWFYEKMDDKLYPGGDIRDYDYDFVKIPKSINKELYKLFELRGQDKDSFESITDAIISLKLNSSEKLAYVKLKTPDLRKKYLSQHINFNIAIIEQEQKSKFNFHLN